MPLNVTAPHGFLLSGILGQTQNNVPMGALLLKQIRKFANWLVASLPKPWQKFYHRIRLFVLARGRSLLRKSVSFSIQGHSLQYFHHPYNETWVNERIIEIPIVKMVVDQYSPHRILEVGNVLSHYFPVRHTVVDKYEESHGVLNEDVVDYAPTHTFDLIVSISTLEHVGWDEEPKDVEKVEKAVQNLLSLLSPGGTLLVTLPLGHNLYLDKRLLAEPPLFPRQFYCRRSSPLNLWRETTKDAVRETRYGTPYPYANGLVIGIFGPNPFG